MSLLQPQELGYRNTLSSLAFTWVQGSELRSSALNSKHFTHVPRSPRNVLRNKVPSPVIQQSTRPDVFDRSTPPIVVESYNRYVEFCYLLRAQGGWAWKHNFTLHL